MTECDHITAISTFFRIVNRLRRQPAVFAGRVSGFGDHGVRNAGTERELTMMLQRWSMPHYPTRHGRPVSIRNTPSSHSWAWMKPKNRFAEYAPDETKNKDVVGPKAKAR